MEAKPESFTTGIDTGGERKDHHFSWMKSGLAAQLPSALMAAALWIWVSSWPRDFLSFEIADGVTFAMILKFCLIAWTAVVVIRLAIAFWHGAQWRRLERNGVTWVARNDQKLPVLFYRKEDGNVVLDETPHDKRLKIELMSTRARRASLAKTGVKLIVGVAVAAVLLLLANLALPQLGDDVVQFSSDWQVVPIAALGAFGVFVVPALSSMTVLLFEELVYRSGAQFIPAPRTAAPPTAPKTLEALRAETVHGTGKIASPAEAARQMSSDRHGG
jgi:hypothetical protein